MCELADAPIDHRMTQWRRYAPRLGAACAPCAVCASRGALIPLGAMYARSGSFPYPDAPRQTGNQSALLSPAPLASLPLHPPSALRNRPIDAHFAVFTLKAHSLFRGAGVVASARDERLAGGEKTRQPRATPITSALISDTAARHRDEIRTGRVARRRPLSPALMMQRSHYTADRWPVRSAAGRRAVIRR